MSTSDDKTKYNEIMKNNEFIHADSIKSHKVDFIVSFETIEHMDENAGDEFLLNFKHIISKGGRLLISTPLN